MARIIDEINRNIAYIHRIRTTTMTLFSKIEEVEPFNFSFQKTTSSVSKNKTNKPKRNVLNVDGDGRINKNDLKYVLELVTIRPKTEDEKKGITKSKKGKTEEELEEEDRLLAEEKD